MSLARGRDKQMVTSGYHLNISSGCGPKDGPEGGQAWGPGKRRQHAESCQMCLETSRLLGSANPASTDTTLHLGRGTDPSLTSPVNSSVLAIPAAGRAPDASTSHPPAATTGPTPPPPTWANGLPASPLASQPPISHPAAHVRFFKYRSDRGPRLLKTFPWLSHCQQEKAPIAKRAHQALCDRTVPRSLHPTSYRSLPPTPAPDRLASCPPSSLGRLFHVSPEVHVLSHHPKPPPFPIHWRFWELTLEDRSRAMLPLANLPGSPRPRHPGSPYASPHCVLIMC